MVLVFSIPSGAVYAGGTVTIQTLSPASTVLPGNIVSFVAAISGFTHPYFSVTDSASSSLRADDIFGSGTFYWTPTVTDVGTHNLTVSVMDFYGNSASVGQSIVVSSSSSLVITPVVATTTLLSLYDKLIIGVVPVALINPNYTVHDFFSGSSLTSSNINTNTGTVTWTPALTDGGLHAITITGTDTRGNSASISQDITVLKPSITTSHLTASTTDSGAILSFTVVPVGFVNPVYQVTDTLSGSSVRVNSSIDASSTFSWSPSLTDIGMHIITILVSDVYGHVATIKQTVTVTDTKTIALASEVAPVSMTTSALISVSTSTTQVTPAISSGHLFTKLLKLGSSGTDVTMLQTILNAQKLYSGPINGSFGRRTHVAVKLFQKAHSIAPLGSVGPSTRAALNALK